jgi:uncharacterized protein (DUF488 family)
MTHPFFTIGHSTRPIEDFLELLRDAGISVVADVRRFPGSRTNPQYGAPAFASALARAGIDYVHLPSLGGRRQPPPDVDPETNALWREPAFHNYADYALGDEFRSGLAALRELGRDRRCAVMCAEAVWWRCHRRIIADYLLAAGEQVFHILGQGHVEEAKPTGGARFGPAGTVTYPRDDLLGQLRPLASDRP